MHFLKHPRSSVVDAQYELFWSESGDQIAAQSMLSSPLARHQISAPVESPKLCLSIHGRVNHGRRSIHPLGDS